MAQRVSSRRRPPRRVDGVWARVDALVARRVAPRGHDGGGSLAATSTALRRRGIAWTPSTRVDNIFPTLKVGTDSESAPARREALVVEEPHPAVVDLPVLLGELLVLLVVDAAVPREQLGR